MIVNNPHRVGARGVRLEFRADLIERAAGLGQADGHGNPFRESLDRPNLANATLGVKQHGLLPATLPAATAERILRPRIRQSRSRHPQRPATNASLPSVARQNTGDRPFGRQWWARQKQRKIYRAPIAQGPFLPKALPGDARPPGAGRFSAAFPSPSNARRVIKAACGEGSYDT